MDEPTVMYMLTGNGSRNTDQEIQLLLHAQIPTLETVYKLKRCVKGASGLFSNPRLFKVYAGYQYSSGIDLHLFALPEYYTHKTENTPLFPPPSPAIPKLCGGH